MGSNAPPTAVNVLLFRFEAWSPNPVEPLINTFAEHTSQQEVNDTRNKQANRLQVIHLIECF
jgi:hypothetical protein